jgi:hypothetical protein
MEDRTTAPMGIDLSRLRRGEVTAAAGALIVLLGLFVPPWYTATGAELEATGGPGGSIPASFGAWSGAGWLGALGNLLVLAAAVCAIAGAVSGGRGIELDGSGRWLLGLSGAATAAVVLRMIFTPTSLSDYHFDADLRLGIFVTLIGTLVLVWGAWRRRPSRSGTAGTEPSGR